MTQSPVLKNSIDTQLTTPIHINLQTDFMAVEHHYHDTFISFQYSEATTPTVAYTNTPMVHFPNQALIKYSLPPIESDPSCNLKRKTFQYVKVDTKRNQKKTALNPMDTMFNISIVQK